MASTVSNGNDRLRKRNKPRPHATCQQIVVKRGNLKLLIVNLKDNTGLCHYVISVRYKYEGKTPCNISKARNISGADKVWGNPTQKRSPEH